MDIVDFDKFLEAVEIMIDEKINSLKFNRVIDGTITEVVDTNTYKVNLLNNIEILNSMNGQEYAVGDIVYVIIFNDNYSNKKILCKY